MAINFSRRRKRGDREVLDEPNGTIIGSNQPRLRGQPLNATGWELVSYLQVNCVGLGCFLERAILTDLLELFGYHLETDQLGGTEGR